MLSTVKEKSADFGYGTDNRPVTSEQAAIKAWKEAIEGVSLYRVELKDIHGGYYTPDNIEDCFIFYVGYPSDRCMLGGTSHYITVNKFTGKVGGFGVCGE